MDSLAEVRRKLILIPFFTYFTYLLHCSYERKRRNDVEKKRKRLEI